MSTLDACFDTLSCLGDGDGFLLLASFLLLLVLVVLSILPIAWLFLEKKAPFLAKDMQLPIKKVFRIIIIIFPLILNANLLYVKASKNKNIPWEAERKASRRGKKKRKRKSCFLSFLLLFFFSSFYPLFWEKENRNPNRKDRTKFGKDELNKYEK